jgi:hypothetical protein
MKNNLFILLALGTLLACFGCSESQHCDAKFGLNELFSLQQGATACLKDSDLTINFHSVSGDSRCPVGVSCIWAGRADVVLTLKLGEREQPATLASGDMSQGGTGQVVFEGYTIKLENVEPPKKEGVAIGQKDYRVKLSVSK